MSEYFDVVVIGAGLSGIDAGYHLQKLCPRKSYVILEQRARIGGTWDLFRFPGVRSDSDMLTMSYSFRPWRGSTVMSSGSDIGEYLASVAREEGIDRHIRFGHRIVRMAWCSERAVWTIEALRARPGGEETVTVECQFVFSCAGYYRYSAGYLPEFAGTDRFRGTVVHPQNWDESVDYAGKKVIVIGSGATAITLLPAIARKARHVTMLQRSPTYVIALPDQDPAANALKRRLPAKWAFRLSRMKNLLVMTLLYQAARRRPEWMKKALLKQVQNALGPNYDVATHFNPRYSPWEQRLCVVPDGDLFGAIRTGAASVATGEIDTFTESGVRLKSGEDFEADIVVTATGLALQAHGGAEIMVDGRKVEPGRTLSYKGVMMSGVPNFAAVFGYVNASWTLKADLICNYVCRVLNRMDRRKAQKVVPEPKNETAAAPFVEHFTPGYMQRAVHDWPKQGARRPWRVNQNYFRDLVSLKWSPVEDGWLKFSKASRASRAE